MLKSLQKYRQALNIQGEYLPRFPHPRSQTPPILPRQEKMLQQVDVFNLCLVCVAILAVTILAFFFAVPGHGFYNRALLRTDVILAGGFLMAFCLAPTLTFPIRLFRQRWRNAYTYCALLGACAFLWVFLVYVGRWQYGSDFTIIIETGWRQIQGQRPYVDFPTTPLLLDSISVSNMPINCLARAGTRTSTSARYLLV